MQNTVHGDLTSYPLANLSLPTSKKNFTPRVGEEHCDHAVVSYIRKS